MIDFLTSKYGMYIVFALWLSTFFTYDSDQKRINALGRVFIAIQVFIIVVALFVNTSE